MELRLSHLVIVSLVDAEKQGNKGCLELTVSFKSHPPSSFFPSTPFFPLEN